jgi:large conductance mechanosensitive channel
MGIIKEFREFAIKGNVIDLAVGVVIGAAFGKIVSSLVDDVITPAILTPALTAANLTELNQLVIPGTAIKYGNFLSEVLAFVIVAFVLFILIKGVNRINKKDKEAEAVVPPAPSKEELLLSEIRDILKAK